MANMKEVKTRIKSVESTKQITKAMELVSFSKLKKAKERAEKTRPYFNAFYKTMCEIAEENTDFTSVFTRIRGEEKNLFIIIGGDRGLAGGYNNNVFKFADSHMKDKSNTKIITVGRKTFEYYKKNEDAQIVSEYMNIAEHIKLREASDIGEIAIKEFVDGNVDNVYVVFTQFLSTLTQEPMSIKLLPIDVVGEKNTKQQKQLVNYEPSPEVVFDHIVPNYIAGIIYSAAVESFASEQGARRTAMESATENAEEMISNLTLLYNRARQGAITQEITEIVSGVNAL